MSLEKPRLNKVKQFSSPKHYQGLQNVHGHREYEREPFFRELSPPEKMLDKKQYGSSAPITFSDAKLTGSCMALHIPNLTHPLPSSQPPLPAAQAPASPSWVMALPSPPPQLELWQSSSVSPLSSSSPSPIYSTLQ